MAIPTTGPGDRREGAVPAFQRLLESIPFLILIGLVMPTVVYTAWSVTEILMLPRFGEAAVHGTGMAGHGQAASAVGPSQAATSSATEAVVAGGPVPGTAVAPGAVRVSMRNMAYAQRTVEIHVGTTVTWTNDDPFPHAVAHGTPELPLEDKAFYSGDFDGGWSFSHTFDQPGIYEVYCSTPGHYAAGMTMTVIVKE